MPEQVIGQVNAVFELYARLINLRTRAVHLAVSVDSLADNDHIPLCGHTPDVFAVDRVSVHGGVTCKECIQWASEERQDELKWLNETDWYE